MSVVYVYYRAHFWLILYKRRLQSNVDLHRGASETLFGKGNLPANVYSFNHTPYSPFPCTCAYMQAPLDVICQKTRVWN